MDILSCLLPSSPPPISPSPLTTAVCPRPRLYALDTDALASMACKRRQYSPMANKCHQCFLGLAQCHDERVAQWYATHLLWHAIALIWIARYFRRSDRPQASESSQVPKRLVSADDATGGSPMPLLPGSSMVRHPSIACALNADLNAEM